MSTFHRIALYAATAASLTALAPTVAHAQTVTFANVADTVTTNGGAFSGFGISSINSGGAVAFYTTLDAGGDGIFTNTVGSSTATTIADRNTTNNGVFNNFNNFVSINDLGTVAFVATLDAGGSGVFTNAGGSSTASIIADNTTTNSGAFESFTAPVINVDGTVAFRANLDSLANGIFTNTVGSPTASIIADSTTTNGGAFSVLGVPNINSGGKVAFFSNLDTGRNGIFTNTAGSSTTASVADTTNTNGGAFSNFIGSPDINTGGTVVFFADLDTGGTGIFTNREGSFTADSIANSTTTNGGAFSFFINASINTARTIAFSATLDAGGSGVFARLPGGNAPFAVVQTGDSLFGSSVTRLSVSSSGLNDSNQLAFNYSLADGRFGIAVAQIVVPEAGTLALAAVGLLAGVGVVVRRKR